MANTEYQVRPMPSLTERGRKTLDAPPVVMMTALALNTYSLSSRTPNPTAPAMRSGSLASVNRWVIETRS